MTAPLPSPTLVLGGARSGKSTFAESLITDGLYLATAQVLDGEMADRVRIHRERRGDSWTTLEEPLDLVGALQANATPNRPILVECLTLWLSNLLGAERDTEAETRTLVEALTGLGGPVVLVSNEVGLGIVPENQLARTFMDAAGRLNQAVAGVADRVVFVAAGLPLNLKGGNP